MKEILKLTGSLALVCLVAGAALAFVSARTDKPIKEARLRERTRQMQLVLPDGVAQTTELKSAEDGVLLFQATDAQGKPLAFCAQATARNGFGGDLTVLVGLAPDGKILGVLVTQNSETPGIGSKACKREEPRSIWRLSETANAPKLPPNEYLDQFKGRSLPAGGLAFDDGFRPVSGATVSSNAVLTAVNRAAKAFHTRPR